VAVAIRCEVSASATSRSVGVASMRRAGCNGRRECPRSVFAQHSSATIVPGSPPSSVSASVHSDRLRNAKPIQRRPHLHCLGNSVHRESVAPADDQRRPLGSILPAPRTPLPGNPPGPFVTGPHPLTESFDDVAAKKSCSATTIRKILDARLRCSGVQQRKYFQLPWTCGIEYDHEGACEVRIECGFVLTEVES